MPASERRLAEIAVLGVMVVWAGNFIVVKSAVAVLPPVGFTFLRFALAAATLLILLRWREGSIRMPRRDLVALCGEGGKLFGSVRHRCRVGSRILIHTHNYNFSVTGGAKRPAYTGVLLKAWPKCSTADMTRS